MLFKSLLLITFISYSVNGRKIHLRVRENVTQSCPNVDSDVIDERSLKITMKMMSTENSVDDYGEKDEVSFTDINGETRRIEFPGCYLIKLSFKLLRPIENPYIEAFLQLGQNLPCKTEDEMRNLHGVDSICANVTNPSKWCPDSYNSNLRDMLHGKSTCKFCSLCNNLENVAEGKDTRLDKIKDFLKNEGNEKCSTNDDIHKYVLKMCIPTQEEMNEENNDAKSKVEEYWQYLKQGIMTTVIHVMDRKAAKSGRSEQCERMCQTLKDPTKISSANYKATLTRSIEKLCAPVDTYAACVMHTVKFNVNTDF